MDAGIDVAQLAVIGGDQHLVAFVLVRPVKGLQELPEFVERHRVLVEGLRKHRGGRQAGHARQEQVEKVLFHDQIGVVW